MSWAPSCPRVVRKLIKCFTSCFKYAVITIVFSGPASKNDLAITVTIIIIHYLHNCWRWAIMNHRFCHPTMETTVHQPVLRPLQVSHAGNFTLPSLQRTALFQHRSKKCQVLREPRVAVQSLGRGEPTVEPNKENQQPRTEPRRTNQQAIDLQWLVRMAINVMIGSTTRRKMMICNQCNQRGWWVMVVNGDSILVSSGSWWFMVVKDREEATNKQQWGLNDQPLWFNVDEWCVQYIMVMTTGLN